ncbi:MAG TPA: DMT family transporter [Bacteroidota bacterium]|nr:DMT family transporter [Bacteroidota bacterium]
MTLVGQRTELLSRDRAFRGYLYLFIAVTLWGGSASLAKILIATRFDTLVIAQTRSTLSFVLLAGFLALRKPGVFIVRPRDLVPLAGVGVIGIAVTNYSYYYTVKEATVATAILVQYTAPLWVTIYAVMIRREESFDGMKLLSLVLALGGCYLAVSGGSPSTVQLRGWSSLTAAASAFGFSYMLIGTKRLLRKYSVWTMLLYAFGFASLFWMFINPPWALAAKHYSISDWAILLLFAVLSILIPHSLYTASLSMLEATTVGIASTLEPVIAILVAYLWLGEGLSGVQIGGGCAVVAAVLLLQEPHLRMLRQRMRDDGD